MTRISELEKVLSEARNSGRKVGLVPTMGALHQGHLSLIKQARSQSDFVVCSVFVNPTQFNNPNDLETYPRQLEQDIALLEPHGCDLVFAPDRTEVYPRGETVSPEDYGKLTQVLEAAHRPGHFDGVIAVVRRLFEMVQPDLAFFGEKDFQQLAVIRELGRREFTALQIVGCPLIRSEKGLALSSRNALMSDAERTRALILYSTLQAAAVRCSHEPPAAVVAWAEQQLAKAEGVLPEYFSLSHQDSLAPVTQWTSGTQAVLLVAANVGPVRLIDNTKFVFA